MDRPQSVTRALANMVGAAVAFTFLNVAVKALRDDLPTVQLVWVRTLGHLLLVIAVFAPLAETAASKVSKTGIPSTSCPPLPGVTPATTAVP